MPTPKTTAKTKTRRAKTTAVAHTRTGPHGAGETDKILARVRSIEGHLRAVADMVERDAYCIDILRQTKAIHAALARVDSLLLERHLGHCVSKAIQTGDPAEQGRVIAEILDVFEASKRS